MAPSAVHADILREVQCELQKAQAKFPPFHSAHEGWAILKEELDELWDIIRINQSIPERAALMHREAIQVAAMALRFLIDLPAFQN